MVVSHVFPAFCEKFIPPIRQPFGTPEETSRSRRRNHGEIPRHKPWKNPHFARLPTICSNLGRWSFRYSGGLG